VVCNGYKDDAYIRLALLAQKLGTRIYLVIEKMGELETVLRIAAEEGVQPLLGVRIKLFAAGSGRWEDSGGEFSKFGLNPAELVEVVEQLRTAGMLDAFRLVHFHLGSQLNDIQRVRGGLQEMARYYAELSKMGAPLELVDIGGGLGVDYDGTRSTDGFSINYTEQEYANDVVGTLADICQREGLPQPGIVTESGRALTAHHAMLAVNVMETTTLDEPTLTPIKGEKPHELVGKISALLKGLSPGNVESRWHDALYFRGEANKMFELGILPLRDRAWFAQLFWKLARRVEQLVRQGLELPKGFEGLEMLLAEKYFCNFSVFQSLPDSWAIGQQFPVVPLHRLEEQPTRRGILQDITCDSDGKLGSYVGEMEDPSTLPLHPKHRGEPYYLGVFLTGAYQEILGDLHNLFGDTNAVHVVLEEDGSWRYEQVIQGESVADVLDYVGFPHDTLIDRIERRVQRGVKQRRLTAAEGKALRDLYVQGLNELTYLEPPNNKTGIAEEKAKAQSGGKSPNSRRAG